MNRSGFSWKRLFGISAAKSRISRAIGIPLTKSGRKRMIGGMVFGGGYLIMAASWIAIPVAIVIIHYQLAELLKGDVGSETTYLG